MQRRDWLALGALTGLILLFFWQTWTPNPADRLAFPIGDFTHQYWPLRRFVARELAAGRLPLWNPYLWGGQPGLADPQAATLYPPAALNAWLWGADFPILALELEAVVHVVWAGWGAYFLARRLFAGDTVLAPLTSGIAFALSGYVTGFPLQQVTIVETVAWAPWWLLALHRAAQAQDLHSRLVAAITAGIVLALAILAGHPQTALYVTYLGLAYAVFRVWRGPSRPWWQRLVPLVVPPLVALGTTAVQLLPTWDFINRSVRATLDFAFVRSGLGMDELVTIVYPNFFGGTPLYVGPAVLLLATLGLLAPRDRLEKFFWAGAGAAGLLLALGGRSPLFQLFYLVLPGWARIRGQERVLFVTALAAALLAGWGVAALSRARSQPRTSGRIIRIAAWTLVPQAVLAGILYVDRARIISDVQDGHLRVVEGFLGNATFALLITLLLIGVVGLARRWPRAGTLIAPALIAFNLILVNQPYHLADVAPDGIFTNLSFIETVHTTAGDRRVNDPNVLGPEANAGLAYGIETLSGNEPLRLAHTREFLEDLDAWFQWKILAVQHVLAKNTLDDTLFDTVATRVDGATLARLKQPRPRVWLVEEVVSVGDDYESAWDRVDDEGFSPYWTATIEGPAPPVAGTGTVELVARRPGYLAARVQADGPALLIASEIADPGWRVWIDGNESTWQRAFGLIIGVAVPAGAHDVELVYAPPHWTLARLISLVTLLGCGLVVVGMVAGWRQR